MARNTLSRAERYHPREKKKQITTKQSPSLCNFLLHYVCRSCPHSLELTSWQKTWAGMRRRSGSKACFVSLIYSFIVLLSFLGNFQKRAQIQNLVSKYRAYAKRQWQSQNTNEQTKQTKKHTTITIDFGKSLTTMHAWIKLIGTVNSYKQFHWCQQKLDRINRL